MDADTSRGFSEALRRGVLCSRLGLPPSHPGVKSVLAVRPFVRFQAELDVLIQACGIPEEHANRCRILCEYALIVANRQWEEEVKLWSHSNPSPTRREMNRVRKRIAGGLTAMTDEELRQTVSEVLKRRR